MEVLGNIQHATSSKLHDDAQAIAGEQQQQHGGEQEGGDATLAVLENMQHAATAALTEEAKASIDASSMEDTGATMYKQYAQDAKAHGRVAAKEDDVEDDDDAPGVIAVASELPSSGDETGASMYKTYAQDAKVHGRAAGREDDEGVKVDEAPEGTTHSAAAAVKVDTIQPLDGQPSAASVVEMPVQGVEEGLPEEPVKHPHAGSTEATAEPEEEAERRQWLADNPLVFKVDENESDIIQKKLERVNMALWEQVSFCHMADLKDERAEELAETHAMIAEEKYVNKMLVAHARAAFQTYKERDLMSSEMWMRKALCIMRKCGTQLAEHEAHFKKMDDASAKLELGAHKLILGAIQKEYQKKGSGVYPVGDGPRHPDNVSPSISSSNPLRRMPPKKDNLYAFRKYVYHGREDDRPSARPLDEGFDIQPLTPHEEEGDDQLVPPKELEYVEGAELIETDVQLELAVDPATLDPAKQRAFLEAVAKEANCHPSQLKVRTIQQRIARDETPWYMRIGKKASENSSEVQNLP